MLCGDMPAELSQYSMLMAVDSECGVGAAGASRRKRVGRIDSNNTRDAKGLGVRRYSFGSGGSFVVKRGGCQKR